MTHAVLPVTALRRASRSVTPSAHGTVFTGSRGPAQYVSTTRRARGDSAPETTIWSRSVTLCAMSAASASAERAVVEGGVGDVHAGQLADHRLVLVDRPQRALARLGLVGRVRGEELAAEEHVIDHARDVVVVGAAPEERHVAIGVGVPLGEAPEVGDQVALGEGGGDGRSRPSRAFDGIRSISASTSLDADGAQHLRPLRRRSSAR